jgi:23S rRNA (pseudouridine1915-N3)-methyltransferase
MEPPIRLELMTAGLQNRCSTNWAKVACGADCIKNACLVKIFFYNLSMITIISVSDGYKHFSGAIEEYTKRTQKYIKIKTIKPVSHTNPEYIKVKETLSIIEVASKMKWSIYLLDERWSHLSTYGLVDLIEDSQNQSTPLIFIIGGSYGIDLEVFAQVSHKTLKISEFVMPHSLALLVLVEQVYRAHEIMKWSGYHHQ